MISVILLLHCALIILEMESGMKLTNAPESTKQLSTLKLKIFKYDKNGEKIKLISSLWSTLSTDLSGLGDLLDHLLEKATLYVEVFPIVRNKISR